MATFTRRPRARLRARSFSVLLSLSLLAPVAPSADAAQTAISNLRPTAPRNVSASPGNRSAIVRWVRPTSNHGSKITHYRITPYLNGVKRARTTVGAVTQARITGLKNAKRYTFRVVAVNTHGDSPPRSTRPITVGAPPRPTAVSAHPVSGGSRVRWKAPATNNGSKLTAYVITPYARGVALPPRVISATTRSRVVQGLTVGTVYTFRVSAKNAIGTSPPSAPSSAMKLGCVGVAMTRGQADIDRHPPGTTFCLSGVHKWTLTPKSGNKLIGPAILNGSRYGGGKALQHAIKAEFTSNVVLSELEIRNYAPANQQGAIFVPDHQKPIAKGWVLRNLRVHDNGTSAGGGGASLGTNWRVLGGRYYNNRQQGLGGTGAGAIVDGVEIDHNNFTNNSYTTQNTDCGFEAGGFKWVAKNVTVRNSKIHHNACKGLWTDVNTRNIVITNNRIFNNWESGIFIEISSGATIKGNTVYGNGFKTKPSCSGWLWGGGITIASSDHVVVANNTVSGNCNGITGTQQHRPDGHPGLLQDISIRDNTISGPGKTGVISDNGANLALRNIVLANNKVSNGMQVCGLKC